MYLTEIAVRELRLDFADGATSITCIVTPPESRIEWICGDGGELCYNKAQVNAHSHKKKTTR